MSARGVKMAEIDVSTAIEIRRPRDEVAAYASNPDNAPTWYVNIKKVEWMTARPLRVGSRVAFVARFLGRQLQYVYEVTEWHAGHRFVMRTAEGPFPMETSYGWESVQNDSTRMTLRNRGNPAGFARILSPFMAMAMRRANEKDLKRLKNLLEGRATP